MNQFEFQLRISPDHASQFVAFSLAVLTANFIKSEFHQRHFIPYEISCYRDCEVDTCTGLGLPVHTFIVFDIRVLPLIICLLVYTYTQVWFSLSYRLPLGSLLDRTQVYLYHR
jgi:hypothetical protein